MNDMVFEILKVCIVSLSGVLVGYLVNFINKKAKEIQAKTDSELLNKYISMLDSTIANCVTATTQTFVEDLKKANTFDDLKKKEAFERTYQSIMSILNTEALDYLNNVYGDLKELISQKIESTIKTLK